MMKTTQTGRTLGTKHMELLRRLTARGVAEFGRYLDQLRDQGNLRPPTDLLADPLYSTPCTLGQVLVDLRGFANRKEFAEYINQRFLEAGVVVDADQPGMWEWLSLFYFDAVCPINNEGKRKPGVDGRHLLSDLDARRRHRHLLRGPYMLWRRYNGGANRELDLLLAHPLPVHGIPATHLGERQRLMNSPGALIAASRLYADRESGSPIRGYSQEENGVRAFCRFLNNLPDCFDLADLSADSILALLPDSFAVWQNKPEELSFPSPQAFDKLKGIGVLRDSRSVALQLGEFLSDIDSRKMTERQVAVRSNMFRTAVLSAYESRCAISGMGLRHTEGVETAYHYEVEAAHIVPVSRGGRDLVRNGLSLNRTIHWAFDLGILWIKDDLGVGLAKEVTTDSRNHWLQQFRDRRIRSPLHSLHEPDPEALRWHARNVAHAV